MKSSPQEVECMASNIESVSVSGSGVADPEDDCNDGMASSTLLGGWDIWMDCCCVGKT
jgi:hypothetical protein